MRRMMASDPNLLSRRSTVIALASVGTVLTLLLLPVLIGNQTLFFRDLSQQYIGTGRLVDSTGWNGDLLWDPFVNGGQPLLGNPNRFVLYPSRLLYFVLNPVAGLNLEIALHLFLGGFGAVLLGRRLGISGAGSAVAGFGYSIGGLSISITNHLGRLMAFHWSPWILLAVHAGLCERGRNSWRWQLSIPVLFAVQWLTGTAETVAITAAFAVGWVVACQPRPEGKGRAVVRCAGLIVLGIGLAAIQIVPAAEMVFRSDRTSYEKRGATMEWSANPLRLPEMVIPGFFGPVDFSDPVSHYWGTKLIDHGFPLILSIYLGASVVFLALFGWAGSRRDPTWSGLRTLFAILVGCALIFACGRYFPLIGTFWSRIPGLSFFRFPVKALLVVALPVALMAGLGVDRLRKLDARASQRFGLSALALAAAFLVLAGWVAVVNDGQALEVIFPERGQVAADGLPGPLMHTALCLAALALASLLSGRVRGGVLSLALVAIVAVDLFVESVASLPMAPREVLTDAPPLIMEIRRELSIGRFFRDQGAKESATSPVGGRAWRDEAWRLWTLADSAAETFLVPMVFQQDIADLCDRRMARLRRATGEVDWSGRAKLFQAGAVEIVLTPQAPEVPGLEFISAYAPPGSSALFLFRVTPSPTMARWVGSGRTVDSPEQALGMLVTPDFDPTKEVVRERDAPTISTPSPFLLSVRPESEILRQVIAAPMVGFVTTAIPWHPDVVVRVNRRPVPMERVNYAFVGFEVGPGYHQIEITFAPRTVFYGVAVSSFSFAVWIFFAVAAWRSPAGRSRHDSVESSRASSPRSA